MYPFVLMYGGAVEFLPIVGNFCQISDICMHQLISQLSTNQLVAEASISNVEHVRQMLKFSHHVLHEDKHMGIFFHFHSLKQESSDNPAQATPYSAEYLKLRKSTKHNATNHAPLTWISVQSLRN